MPENSKKKFDSHQQILHRWQIKFFGVNKNTYLLDLTAIVNLLSPRQQLFSSVLSRKLYLLSKWKSTQCTHIWFILNKNLLFEDRV